MFGIQIGFMGWLRKRAGSGSPSPRYLLQENGDKILAENGDFLILER